jgi:spoIIIJ-associated protein
MNRNRTTIEKIAPSIEEAIEHGLNELGLQREDVEIEILDEGSRGLFGLGARQARVRLTVNLASQPATAPQDKGTAQEAARPVAGPVADAAPEQPAQEPDRPVPAKKVVPAPASLEEELTLNAAKEALVELLGYMQVEAEVTAYYGEADERQSRPPVMIDLTGKDLSILIGKKAETLSALQYIAGLIVSKKVGHTITLVVDVENYRQRRASQVRQLANRVADQVSKTGRRQALEPMPANERRLVHMELRGNPLVRTESTGEEPHRKVIVYPAD